MTMADLKFTRNSLVLLRRTNLNGGRAKQQVPFNFSDFDNGC